MAANRSNQKHYMGGLEFISQNSVKPCVIDQCGRTRHGASPYCKSHQKYAKNRRLYGWPTGHKLTVKMLKPYRQAAAELINKNLSHALIKDNIKSLDTWIQNALEGQLVPVPDAADWAHTNGSDGRKIFTDWCGIMYYAMKNPHSFPNEKYPLMLALARSLLQSGKIREIKSMTTIRSTGSFCWRYATALYAVAKELMEKPMKDAKRREAWHSPFDWLG
jgi:hypothetical protein